LASANIVGYSQNALVDGFKASGASFVNIGGTGCNLTDLVPVGIGDKSLGVIGVQFLDASGKMTANYGYYKGGTGKRATEGWYQGMTLITTENDVPIPAGSGLWIKGAAGLSIQTSGQVLNAELHCDLVDGFRLLSNPFSADTTLTKLVPTGIGDKSLGVIAVQFLDASGKMTANYGYYKGGTAKRATEGWYQGMTLITTENDVTIPAGTGVWVKGAAGLGLTFKVPYSL
jgi:hypothetical protein